MTLYTTHHKFTTAPILQGVPAGLSAVSGVLRGFHSCVHMFQKVYFFPYGSWILQQNDFLGACGIDAWALSLVHRLQQRLV